jgi:hypothetical protein
MIGLGSVVPGSVVPGSLVLRSMVSGDADGHRNIYVVGDDLNEKCRNAGDDEKAQEDDEDDYVLPVSTSKVQIQIS